MPLCGLSHVCPAAAFKANLYSLFILLPSVFYPYRLNFQTMSDLHLLMPRNAIHVKLDGVVSSELIEM